MSLLLLLALAVSAADVELWRIDQGYGRAAWAQGQLAREELARSRPLGKGRAYMRGGKTVLVRRVEEKGWRYEDADGNVLVTGAAVEGGAEYRGRDGKVLLRRMERGDGKLHFTDAARKPLCVWDGGAFKAGKRSDVTVAESKAAKALDGTQQKLWTVSDPLPLRQAGEALFPALPLGAHNLPLETWFIILMSEELEPTGRPG